MSLINFARRILAQAPRLPISATSSYVHRSNLKLSFYILAENLNFFNIFPQN